jgi:ATP/maltotriose-dependent transcriptional regulator MalT
VHQKASAWFETAGHIDRAVRHAVAADDVDRAERLVVDQACRRRPRSEVFVHLAVDRGGETVCRL